MNVGDIHWVEFPQAGGREQQGRRPAIIMQDNVYGGSLPTTLVVPLSSAKRALRFAGTPPQAYLAIARRHSVRVRIS